MFPLLQLKAWHRKCYKCKDCRKHLDSINTCEGPDNDIYCKGNITQSITLNQQNQNYSLAVRTNAAHD